MERYRICSGELSGFWMYTMVPFTITQFLAFAKVDKEEGYVRGQTASFGWRHAQQEESGVLVIECIGS